ncbi:unnamed protein product [Symbiodinium natans]|uniref:Uncharacterized protein n=1 Tax=Symbiodinium natans TaxID=878477 RepID=A0A812SDK0_9DINO|nr:unnamed protein product [Symbiodinium natans]
MQDLRGQAPVKPKSLGTRAMAFVESRAARCGLVVAATASAAGGCWEVRRKRLWAEMEAARVRYRDTGSETRFPFYGRDWGYEVDYMLELGLQPGDRCFAEYRLEALPLTHACAVALRRRLTEPGKVRCDEEAVIELVAGQRHCRHGVRPGPWWAPWRPAVEAKALTRYSDWLAWPVLGEVRILRLAPDRFGSENWCTVR